MGSLASKKTVLIIPVYNNTKLTEKCLQSIFDVKEQNPRFEVLVVDDGSAQDTKDCLTKFPISLLTNETNLGYMVTTNRGIDYALKTMGADHVALMNNDLVVFGGWLKKLVDVLAIYDIAGYIDFGRSKLGSAEHKEAYFVEGSCMIAKREVFDKIGTLDFAFKNGYYSDGDFCLRALLDGFKIGILNNTAPVFVEHHGGQTFGSKRYDNLRASYNVFYDKWHRQKGNPFVDNFLGETEFNPNKLIFRIEDWVKRTLGLGDYKKRS